MDRLPRALFLWERCRTHPDSNTITLRRSRRRDSSRGCPIRGRAPYTDLHHLWTVLSMDLPHLWTMLSVDLHHLWTLCHLWTCPVHGPALSVDLPSLWTCAICGPAPSVDWAVRGPTPSMDLCCLWTSPVRGPVLSTDLRHPCSSSLLMGKQLCLEWLNHQEDNVHQLFFSK